MFKFNQPLGQVLIWILMILLIRLVGFYTSFADTIYPKINTFFQTILSAFSSLFSFSLGDVIYTLLGFLLMIWMYDLGNALIKKKRYKIKKQIWILFFGVNLFTLFFHLLWGFNYYKTPLKNHFKTENITVEELKEMAEIYLQKSIKDRELVPENSEGIFEFNFSDNELSEQLMTSSVNLNTLDELHQLRISNPSLKKSMYSTAISYLGVLGYYNPFTSEAQYNSKMPDTKLLFTKFHETAHQWGAAPESEANFVGFLIGIKTDNKSFNYVANYKALRSILSKIVWVDSEYVKSMLERYSPKMQRDREYELEIERKYLNKAEDAFSMLNNAYLQFNNQDGLESYGQFVELLVGYHRQYGAE